MSTTKTDTPRKRTRKGTTPEPVVDPDAIWTAALEAEPEATHTDAEEPEAEGPVFYPDPTADEPELSQMEADSAALDEDIGAPDAPPFVKRYCKRGSHFWLDDKDLSTTEREVDCTRHKAHTIVVPRTAVDSIPADGPAATPASALKAMVAQLQKPVGTATAKPIKAPRIAPVPAMGERWHTGGKDWDVPDDAPVSVIGDITVTPCVYHRTRNNTWVPYANFQQGKVGYQRTVAKANENREVALELAYKAVDAMVAAQHVPPQGNGEHWSGTYAGFGMSTGAAKPQKSPKPATLRELAASAADEAPVDAPAWLLA